MPASHVTIVNTPLQPRLCTTSAATPGTAATSAATPTATSAATPTATSAATPGTAATLVPVAATLHGITVAISSARVAQRGPPTVC